MQKRILWVAAALVLIAIPAVIGLVALRDDDSSSESRRAGALVARDAAGFTLDMGPELQLAGDKVIDVNSWSWGVSNSTTAYSTSTGGVSPGKAQFNEFNLTKRADSASPKLFLHCAKGTHFAKVTLHMRKAGETQQDYMVITLEQVIISSVQLAGSGPGDEGPEESVSLNFAKATVSASEIQEGKVGAPVMHSWDLRTAKAG